MATTHGDHTIKIIHFATGKVVKTLVGHPRTPWTVKFHPKLNNIVASGCLAGEVKVWDLSRDGVAPLVSMMFPLNETEEEKAAAPQPAGSSAHHYSWSPASNTARSRTASKGILSLAFSNGGDTLAVACGPKVYLWKFAEGRTPSVVFRAANNKPVEIVSFPLGSRPQVILIGYNRRDSSRPTRADEGPSLCLFDLSDSDALRKQGLSSHFLFVSCRLLSVLVLADPFLLLPHANFHSDHGVAVSKCGRYLAYCQDSKSSPRLASNSGMLFRGALLFDEPDLGVTATGGDLVFEELEEPSQIRVISLVDNQPVRKRNGKGHALPLNYSLGSIVASVEIPNSKLLYFLISLSHG